MTGRILFVFTLVSGPGCAGGEADPGEPGASRSGCQLDTDCAGERLCDEGECVKWWKMKGHPPEVTPEQLAAWLEQEDAPQLLDVRTEAEYRLGHIEGAVSVPLGELEERLESLPFDESRPVVAVCLTAHRSIGAVRLLSRRGYDIVQLQGGMQAWKKAGLPRVKPD